MTFGSLFSGIGGFDIGFERAGLRCAWQVENNPDCNRVLSKHWGSVPRLPDVATVGKNELEPVDLICGGFPCQDLSVAGNRAGLAGERSGLWHEFARILSELKPSWCVIENVPGLHSSWSPTEPPPGIVEGSEWEVEESSDFETLLVSLSKLGYFSAACVLDSQYFGVPQRRDRVFIVGHLGAGGAPEILFEPESVRGDSPPSREAGERVAGTLTKSALDGSSATGGDGRENLFVVGAIGDGSRGYTADAAAVGHYVVGTLSPGARPGSLQRTGCLHRSPDRGACHSNGGGQIAISGVASPLTTTYGKSLDHAGSKGSGPDNAIVERRGVRRLTPRECERLQGFEDDWTRWDSAGREISDSARYRMLGNAVTTYVPEWIGGRLEAFST